MTRRWPGWLGESGVGSWLGNGEGDRSFIVLVDDMGYGDPGCYNPNSKIPTPSIDRLAREGMRFTDAHAAGPLCHPSRYGLLTGRYPFRTDVSVWPKKPLIEEGQMTLASLLQSQGYRTAMVGKWHLGFLEVGYDQPLSGGLRGMKSDAWEGGHRVPFIVRWPERVKAGTVSDQTIGFTDLLATLADICGITLPDGAGPDSFSFLPVLEGVQPAGKPVRGPIVMQAGSVGSMMMIRSGDWKLIQGLGSGGFSRPSSIQPEPGEPAVQLYHLRADPAETRNLAAEHPDKVDEMVRLLESIRQAKQTRN